MPLAVAGDHGAPVTSVTLSGGSAAEVAAGRTAIVGDGVRAHPPVTSPTTSPSVESRGNGSAAPTGADVYKDQLGGGVSLGGIAAPSTCPWSASARPRWA